MSAHKFDYELGPLHKLVICFDYSPGRPGCNYLRNGDPGYPDEPEEIEPTDVQVWVRASADAPWVKTGVSLPEEVTNNDWLDQRIAEYLDVMRYDIAGAAWEQQQERNLERGYP